VGGEGRVEYCVGLWRRNERGEGKIKFDFCDFVLYFFLEHNYATNGTASTIFSRVSD
jgi:hypothetical protein